MNEGKFKKQALYEYRTFLDLFFEREERLKEYTTIETHPDPLLDYFVSLEKFDQWIEEAKKEFPKIKQRKLVANPYGEIDWETVAKMIELKLIKIQEWFLKWFGEKK